MLTVAINALLFGLPVSEKQLFLNIMGLNGVFGETLANNAPLWTLAYEIWFYGIGGAIGYVLSTKSPSIAAFLIIGCCICVFSVQQASYLLFWMLGALATLLRDVNGRARLAVAGLILAAGGTVSYQLASESKSFVSAPLISQALAEGVICVGVSLALPFASDKTLNTLLRPGRKILVYLSSVSYSLYLFHYPLSGLWSNTFPAL